MANFTVAAGNIIEVSCWQSYQSSRLLNIYHFRYDDGQPPTLDGETLMQDIMSNVWDTYYDAAGRIRDQTTSDLKYDMFRGQVVWPQRYYYVPRLINQSGNLIGVVGAPSDVQLCCTYRSAVVGRGVNGRKAFGGLNVADFNGALWSNGLLNQFRTQIAPVLRLPLVGLGPENSSITPVVWSPKNPGTFHDIAAIYVQEEVRVQRRRQFRLGI